MISPVNGKAAGPVKTLSGPSRITSGFGSLTITTCSWRRRFGTVYGRNAGTSLPHEEMLTVPSVNSIFTPPAAANVPPIRTPEARPTPSATRIEEPVLNPVAEALGGGASQFETPAHRNRAGIVVHRPGSAGHRCNRQR